MVRPGEAMMYSFGDICMEVSLQNCNRLMRCREGCHRIQTNSLQLICKAPTGEKLVLVPLNALWPGKWITLCYAFY